MNITDKENLVRDYQEATGEDTQAKELAASLSKKLLSDVAAYQDTVRSRGVDWVIDNAYEVAISNALARFADLEYGDVTDFCEYHPKEADTLLHCSGNLVDHAVSAFINMRYEYLPNIAQTESVHDLMKSAVYYAEQDARYTVMGQPLFEETAAENGIVITLQKDGKEMTNPLRGEGGYPPYCNRIEDMETVDDLTRKDIAVIIGESYHAPIVMFDPERLQVIDPAGLADYETKAGISEELREAAILEYRTKKNAAGTIRRPKEREKLYDMER